MPNIIQRVIINPPSASYYVSGTVVGVTMSCPTTGVDIYYTFDGSHPTGTSTSSYLYTAPFTVIASGTTMIRATAYKSGWTSPTWTTTYVVSFPIEGAFVTGGLSLVYTANNTASLAPATTGSLVDTGSLTARLLLVGGGGAGGGGIGGGGGGGGVVKIPSASIPPGVYTVEIGDGGKGVYYAPGNNGGNTRIFGMVAAGGGGGGGQHATNGGKDGGCGGGSPGINSAFLTGGAATGSFTSSLYSGTIFGYPGGVCVTTRSGNPTRAAGGGGAGGYAPDTDSNYLTTSIGSHSAGGSGVLDDIIGPQFYWGGGGGGGAHTDQNGGWGGAGGGGGGDGYFGGGLGGSSSLNPGGNGKANPTYAGITGSSGGANTGGGGGGSNWQYTVGGTGGKGIVVIRYPPPVRAVGGTVTRVASIIADVLVVGGGGAGGSSVYANIGAGGGAGGGVLYSTQQQLRLSSYAITVGTGGLPNSGSYGNSGGSSSFGSLLLVGGGGGGGAGAGAIANRTGVAGWNGGGGGAQVGPATPGGAGYGGYAGGSSNTYYGGGGGGGAGATGSNGNVPPDNSGGGKGGDGVLNSITGVPTYYGGGGGGGVGGAPGLGGGGKGGYFADPPNPATYATSASASLGGGGGGSYGANGMGGSGSSGLVIVRYSGTQRATGGTVTTDGGYTIHTFTSGGTFTVNDDPNADVLHTFYTSGLFVYGYGTSSNILPSTWKDISGNGNDGTFVSGVQETIFNNGMTYAVNLDGATGYIVAPNSASLNMTGSWSALLWINRNTTGTQMGLLEKYDWVSGYGGYILRISSSDTLVAYETSGTSAAPLALSSTVTISSSQWKQVGCVFDCYVPAIGYDGGVGYTGNPYSGGGGGGAGQVGGNSGNPGGKGGDGVVNSITGVPVYYGGGGGGSSRFLGGGNIGLPGLGGGGTGTGIGNGTPGSASLGGGGGAGGGGSSYTPNIIGGAGGSGVVIIRYENGDVQASGGLISSSLNYVVHVFTGSDTFNLLTATNVDVLVVGGGGAGGDNGGGGGGGGGVIYSSSFAIPTGSLAVTVGTGGTNAYPNILNGGSSSFSTITAFGGGRGASRDDPAMVALSGGSGGGGANATNTAAVCRIAGSGTAGQGYAGGNGPATDLGANGGGGGGGGAGQAGATGSTLPGKGGDGVLNSISGVPTYYGGGGGGGQTVNGMWASGGLGGGGRGSNSGSAAVTGTNGLGGGGGGGGTGAAGGSGIVIVRYSGSVSKATGGAITYITGFTYHRFTSSADFSSTVDLTTSVLLVGGGGGGGGGWQGGGGGAGGVRYLTGVTVASSTIYPVVVGSGGLASNSGSTNGSASSFNSQSVPGGGNGAGEGYNNSINWNAGSGGSGGGACHGTTGGIYAVGLGLNTRMNLYIDGVRNTGTTFTVNPLSSTSSLYVGVRSTAPSFSGTYYNGAIGAVVLYNRALSSSEVLQNYSASVNLFIPPALPTATFIPDGLDFTYPTSSLVTYYHRPSQRIVSRQVTSGSAGRGGRNTKTNPGAN